MTLLTLFAVAIAGYHPFAEDGGLYAASIERLIDPTLFPHDAAFVLEPAGRSIFAVSVAALAHVSHIPLAWLLLVLHLASLWLTLRAAWALAARSFTHRGAQAGSAMLLACWLGMPVAGTALFVMDPYLTARSFAVPAMLLACIGALDATEFEPPSGFRARGWTMCAFAIVACLALHPLMGMDALGITVLLVTQRARHRALRLWGPLAAGLTAVASAAAVVRFSAPETTASAQAALTRSYWFLSQWHWYEWIGLAAPLVILGTAGWWKRGNTTPNVLDARTALARAAVIAGITACVFAAIYARTNGATFAVARLQPLRMFQAIYLVMTLLLGGWLGKIVLQRSAWRWAAVATTLGCVMFAVARDTYAHTRHIEWPRAATGNAWVEAFQWIRSSTPRNAFFAMDADYVHASGEDAHSFRAIAERSALPDFSKDGGEASIAPALAPAWAQGVVAQQGLDVLSDSQRIRQLQPLGVTWVVLASQAQTAFLCPYRNASVQVCKLPQAGR